MSASDKRAISVMGDGGFWHNGLASAVGNAVFNKQDGVILVVDNYYSAATGGQDILSSRASTTGAKTNNCIVEAVKGIGAKWVRQIDRTYDVGKMRDVLREALTTQEGGPKIIVASSECSLNKQRRVKPLFAQAVKEGKRRVKERFGVDEDVCTGDHACIRLSGCPSLSVKHTDDPLKDDPVAAVDNTCVGCGNCGEVAEAAVLCPSFYRADIIHNPEPVGPLLAQTARRGHRLSPAPPRSPTRRLRRESSRDDAGRIQARVDATADHARRAGDGRAGRRRADRLDRRRSPNSRAGARSRHRCPASPSGPARRSIISRCCRPGTAGRRCSR